MVVSAKTCVFLLMGTVGVSSRQIFLASEESCNDVCERNTGSPDCETGSYTVNENNLISLTQKQCVGDLIENSSPHQALYHDFTPYNNKKCVRYDGSVGVCQYGYCSACVTPDPVTNCGDQKCWSETENLCGDVQNVYGACASGYKPICSTEDAFDVESNPLKIVEKLHFSDCNTLFAAGLQQVCKCASNTCDGGGEDRNYCAIYGINDGYCDYGCNNENCNYDGADCVAENYKIGALGESCAETCSDAISDNPNPMCNEITPEDVGAESWITDNCLTVEQSVSKKAIVIKHLSEGQSCGTSAAGEEKICHAGVCATPSIVNACSDDECYDYTDTCDTTRGFNNLNDCDFKSFKPRTFTHTPAPAPPPAERRRRTMHEYETSSSQSLACDTDKDASSQMICNCIPPTTTTTTTTTDAPTTEEEPEVFVETLELQTTMPWESIATLESVADQVFVVPFDDGIQAYDWGVRDKKLYAVFDIECTQATDAIKKTIEDGMRRHFGDGQIVFSCGSLIATMSPHTAAGPEFSQDGDTFTANDKAITVGVSAIVGSLLIIVAVALMTRGKGGYRLLG